MPDFRQLVINFYNFSINFSKNIKVFKICAVIYNIEVCRKEYYDR